jgi:hypothetical protein
LQLRASQIILLICALSILGTAFWGIRNGYFIASSLVLVGVLWELKSQSWQPQKKTRTILSAFLSLLAVALNLGLVLSAGGQIGVIAAIVVGGIILAVRDLGFRKNSVS